MSRDGPAAPNELRLGVDLGGTKTEAVVLRLRGDRGSAEGGTRLGDDPPEVLARVRVPTERDEGYDHVVATTARVITQATRDAGLAEPPPIGVGMPGGTTLRTATGERSPVPLIKNSNTTCLNGRPFRDDLVARVGRPIAFANDANCFALAEATFGAARDATITFGVILGTGVGGGVVVRAPIADPPKAGRVSSRARAFAWDGAQGIAGEWGHVVLEPRDGPPCYCGRRGCIETFLSGPAIERAYAARSGISRSLRELATLDEPAARATLDDVVETFGRALAIVIDVLDPDVIVLGGGVSNLEPLYDRGVAAVARWVFNDELRTRIVKHELGDSAGVYGAALLPA